MKSDFRLVNVDDLREHEEIEEPRVRELVAKIRADGFMYVPIVADARTLVVIDGHHRLNALKRLGARRIPTHLVDYDDPSIRVDTWREGERAPTKAEVVAKALAGEKYPPKSTKHAKIYGLPEVRVDLKELM